MADDLAMAIERNVGAFLLALGAAGGGVERADDEITWTVGGSPIGYHNAVVACDAASAARARELVQEFAAALDHHRAPGSWHLTPAMRPADTLAALLADGEAGFDDGGDEPAMARTLADLPPVPPHDERLVVRAVDDDAALDAGRDVLADGFGEGPPEADWVRSVFRTAAATGDDRWVHLVGTIDDEPVATTTVFVTDDVAGIYFVATRPAHRRRGIGAAVTHRGLVEARARGAATAVLGSSPMGQRVYEALGFRTVFSYQLFERESPTRS